MTETPAASPAIDEALKNFKHSFETSIAAIKRDLAQWLDQRRADTTAATTALIETAFDQYLAARTNTACDVAPAAANAHDMVQPILRRAVQRRRVTLHKTASRTKPAVPLNDEECANRLTEIFKMLDALALPLPKDAALRQYIDDAMEPLEILLGYFVGGIDQPPGLQSSPRPKTEPMRAAPTPSTPDSESPAPAPEFELSSRAPMPFEIEEW